MTTSMVKLFQVCLPIVTLLARKASVDGYLPTSLPSYAKSAPPHNVLILRVHKATVCRTGYWAAYVALFVLGAVSL